MEYQYSTLIKKADLVLLTLITIIGISEAQIRPIPPNILSNFARSMCSDCSCCVNNACNNDTICLLGCDDGYHGRKCLSICPENCIRCTDHINPDVWSTANCTTNNCVEGYYSTEDHYQCQDLCPSKCRSCSSSDSCTECKTGFAEELCDTCVAGKYGLNCNITCPDNCGNVTCERETGNCYSCIGNYNLPTCYICKDGFYGSDCEYQCSVNCKEGKCQKDNGQCINGCKFNFAGQTCDSCEDGYYGNSCQNKCPNKCDEYRCERTTGNCNSCMGNFKGSKCDTCENGFYLNSFPVTETSICQACLNTCNTCSSPNSCTECKNGSYGASCEMTCPEKCIYRRCSQTEGTCKNCMEGYAGKFCLQNLTQIDEENNSAAIGGAVGGVLGLVVIIVTVIVVLRWRRMICKGKSCFTREKHYENEPSIVNKKRAKIELQLKDLQREDDIRKQKMSELNRQLQQLSVDSDNTGESGSTYEILDRDSEVTGYSTLRV